MNRKIFSAFFPLLLWTISSPGHSQFLFDHGGIVRGDTSRSALSLVFTGGDFADGGQSIRQTLGEKKVHAAFFFTGDFYRDPANKSIIAGLIKDGHYLGPHSDKHLLYAPWEKRDSSLVGEKQFKDDLLANYCIMESFGLKKTLPAFFIPPYEWYNEIHVRWARQLGVILFNFTPGTSSNADYTTPDMPSYRSSQSIYDKILAYEEQAPHGLNGFILLLHIGTDPSRTDKMYLRLGGLIDELRKRGYRFERLDHLLQGAP